MNYNLKKEIKIFLSLNQDTVDKLFETAKSHLLAIALHRTRVYFGEDVLTPCKPAQYKEDEEKTDHTLVERRAYFKKQYTQLVGVMKK